MLCQIRHLFTLLQDVSVDKVCEPHHLLSPAGVRISPADLDRDHSVRGRLQQIIDRLPTFTGRPVIDQARPKDSKLGILSGLLIGYLISGAGNRRLGIARGGIERCWEIQAWARSRMSLASQ
ncbi:hypothetical protein G6F68_018152 [Rhizopus microsporus]|nr:hypothetical protein G6F68_018152 [Rhizopus microsporus]